MKEGYMLLRDLGLGTLPSYSEPRESDIVVRQSTIGSLQLCPGRVGHALDPGFDPTPSDKMVLGSLTHAVIEEGIKVAVERDGELDHWPLALQMRQQVRRLLDEIAVADGWVPSEVATVEQLDELVDTAIVAAVHWYEQLWVPELHQLEILEVESKLVRPLGVLPDGRAIWLQGTPDLITPGTVIDWKTAGRGWKVNNDGLGKGSFLPQAPLYLWLAEDAMGGLGRHFTFCVYDVSTSTWESHATEWDERAIQAALLNAWNNALMIAHQVFPYTPYESVFGKFKRGWWCSSRFCGAWDTCPGKAMISDGTDLDEKRDPTW